MNNEMNKIATAALEEARSHLRVAIVQENDKIIQKHMLDANEHIAQALAVIQMERAQQ